MKLRIQTPGSAIKALGIKFTPIAADVEKFAKQLSQYRAQINSSEREEHFKQPLRKFLSALFDPEQYPINTQHNQDLAIYLENGEDSRIAVMFETKKPGSSEMIRADRINVKALHELVLYYFEEKLKRGNFQLKYLIASDYLNFIIFDANDFHRFFFQNSEIKKLYETKVNDGHPNSDFYPTLERIIDKFDKEIPCVHFNLDNPEKLSKSELVGIFKILSPRILLKQRSVTDRNALNRSFYDELLHILGLTEKKDGKKITIVRLDAGERKAGSILELAIAKLEVKYPCNFTPSELASYGSAKNEQIFAIAFELCLTWINRILFLKLLEAQIIRFHPEERGFAFLNIEKTGKFNKLFNLFHYVLAVKPQDRNKDYTQPFENVPYLNSSLFDISEIERKSIDTTALDDSIVLPYFARTVLKQQLRDDKKLDTLSYLFDFLDSFNYASVTHAQLEIADDRLINASILGKIFEKINGYRDGSIYTPGFITMYMCRETIRPAIVKKFNEEYGWDIETFAGLRNKLGRYSEPEKLVEFSSVVDTSRVCDPAVGSGHFLVSTLNELITIKYELGILCDETGRSFSGIEVRIDDDELRISNNQNEAFHYEVLNGRPNGEAQRLQRTLFHQKQTLIENCLFGVDINPNSVAICRLRLWIELLKHSYYREDTNFQELETLPNIDINIKRGNSLVSRFELRDTFVSRHAVDVLLNYAQDIHSYRSETNKDKKQAFHQSIEKHRKWLSSQLPDETSEVKSKIDKKLSLLAENQNILFHQRTTEEKERKVELLKRQLKSLNEELDAINRKYDHAFEWRYEFPEVLDEKGNYKGFDVVIGNPPYIRGEALGPVKRHLQNKYAVYASVADILVYFYELGLKLLVPKGELSYITSNKFIKSGYGEPLRKYLRNFQVNQIIDFGELPVFENAATFPVVIGALNYPRESEPTFTQIKNLKFESLKRVVDEQSFQLTSGAFSGPTWTLARSNVIELLRKIERNMSPLHRVIGREPERGVITGLSEAFVIDVELRERMIDRNPECAEIIVPFATGDDIRKYKVINNDTYLILTKIGTDMARYPAVFEHLSQFEDKLRKRVDKGNHWWELRACAYYDDFEQPRIIYPDIAKESRMVYTEDTLYVANTAYIIPTAKRYLTAILNSKLMFFYYSQISSVLGDAQEGGRLRWFTQYVSQLPIRIVDEPSEKRLDRLVQEITEKKAINEVTDSLEEEIETLVYDLYEIDRTERQFIDRFFIPQSSEN